MARGDRSASTREALLGAGARVFATRGPYGARVREIAREAGLTVPALYYHFEGTENLYEEVVRAGRERFTRLAEVALETPGGQRARLLALARAYVDFGREDPVRLRLLCLELFLPREGGEPDRSLDELNVWLCARVDEVLDTGIREGELPRADVIVARRLFMAVLSGLLVEQARRPETPLLDESVAERAVAIFVGGMSELAPS
jgi:AcrR family transcriptional regulator